MPKFVRHFGRAVRHVYTGFGLYAQALAFNMFLSFFPMLLFLVGLLASSRRATAVLIGVLSMRWVLPPDSRQFVFDYLHQHSTHPGRWLAVACTASVMAGTQFMSVLLNSFHAMEGTTDRTAFWKRYLRSLALLFLALGPAVAGVFLTAFGEIAELWLGKQFGAPRFVQRIWLFTAEWAALAVALIILALLYRAGQPSCKRWQDGLPGAALAIGMWWLLNFGFGAFVRRTTSNPIYGGLAAVLGLLIWMQLNSMVVLIGAAFNTELAREGAQEACAPVSFQGAEVPQKS